jgi:hypothetical protein
MAKELIPMNIVLLNEESAPRQVSNVTNTTQLTHVCLAGNASSNGEFTQHD